MIKDSGDRTEFETGAKRDMHAGKGRMDLLPWYGIRVFRCIRCWTVLLGIWQSTWLVWTMRTTFELPVGTCSGHSTRD